MTKRMSQLVDVNMRDRKGESDYLDGLSRHVKNDQDLNNLIHDQENVLR